MNPLLSAITLAAKAVGQTIPQALLQDVQTVLEVGADAPVLERVRAAWQAGSLTGEVYELATPGAGQGPFLARAASGEWWIVLARNADGSWTVRSADGRITRLDSIEGAICIGLPVERDDPFEGSDPANPSGAKTNARRLVLDALWQNKSHYIEAILATVLTNILAITTSLFSMQVYDRVIPNRGFATLVVLSVGVGAAILLELLLKYVRGVSIERTAKRIDESLSVWFYNRLINIRLEHRPSSIGSLASQVKGFESVRAILSSTSLFVLVDIPFALLFILIIGLIGGRLVLVPLLMFPISLGAGVMFQKQIAYHARQNQGQSHRKAGLLVESIDGAESFKANGADWSLQRRWSGLVDDAGASDYKVKNYSSLSQHMTVSLQQLGYVGLVAFGAYLVADNKLTMGALIACTIISGRAMSPIAQLPATLVQWSNARAASNGLDKLISLPNDNDDRGHALVPEIVDGAMRVDGVKFLYGHGGDAAVDIEQLDIKAGERIGIIGTIGSGKSTLLKLMSGLFRPAAGRISINGIDMALILPEVLHEKIAYLPQEIRLISGTLRGNLVQGLPDPGDERLLEVARLTGLVDLITRHPKGLALPITEGGRGISGGQRQLIGLTRLLLMRPKVLVLDEPTASMDAVTEKRIVAVIDAIAARGTTVLVATHKTALLPVTRRLLVMRDGRIVMDGPRDQVIEKLFGTSPAASTSEV
jgi:ATP-binding cassette, subfamily C, bacterial LapB